MPYIGNTIRAADDYRLIDDISSSFNGSTTSFALQVAGSAPVPFPKSPQQVLISVNGVIQEPDPTGASGFNLVGTNIVFSSAPTNGHAFFGIIYATADYLNSGGNFPSGSTGSPSLTFIGDEDTGIYRKGSGSVGFVSNSTEIANTDSNGITISSGNLILGDSSGTSSDRVSLGASGDLHIYHDGTDSQVSNATGDLKLFSVGGNADDVLIRAQDDIELQPNNGQDGVKVIGAGAVELYHNNSKKFQTSAEGVDVVSSNLTITDSYKARFGAGLDLQIYHSSNQNYIEVPNAGTGDLNIMTNGGKSINIKSGNNVTGSNNAVICNNAGSVDLYHNGTKRIETTSYGVAITSSGSSHGLKIFHSNGNEVASLIHGGSGDEGSLILKDSGTSTVIMRGELSTDIDITTGGNFDLEHDSAKLRLGAGADLQLYHDGSNSTILNATGNLLLDNSTSTGDVYINSGDDIFIRPKGNTGVEDGIKLIGDGAVEVYYDGSKKFETASHGITVSGEIRDDRGNIRDIQSEPLSGSHSSRTLVDADAGKVVIMSGNLTIPSASGGGPFGGGSTLTILNKSGSAITLTQGTGLTLYNTADATTGNRTLAGRGIATIYYLYGGNEAYISGAGLS